MYQSIADWPQGTRFPFKVVGTMPDTLASKASYEYWLVAEPEALISYVPGTARVEAVHADGSSVDITPALSVTYSNGTITAGAPDILSAIPGLKSDDELVLYYTCEYNPGYNLGFGHGNPSWAHVEYSPSGSASQASFSPASGTVRTAGYAPSSIAAQAAGSPSSNLSRTPDVKATVYCYALSLEKVAADTGKSLPGASFKLHDSSGLWYAASGGWTDDASAAAVMVTDAEGTLLFPGLDAEAYTLVEAAPPAGYSPIGDAAVTLESGIPEGREWLRASSEDVEVTAVDSEKGTIGVRAIDPRSGGGPSSSSSGGSPSSSSGPGSGSGGSGGGSGQDGGIGADGSPLSLTGDPSTWTAAAMLALAAGLVAALAVSRARRRG